MKFFLEEIYNEALKFAGEFTFGYEIEGWVDGDAYYKRQFEKEIQEIAAKFDSVGGESKFEDDGSIYPGGLEDCQECDDGSDYDGYDCEYCNGSGQVPSGYHVEEYWTFEYNSPILKFNPYNISKTFELLNRLMELEAQTNETCGFHIHLGFPIQDDINKSVEIFWCLCQLVNNEDLLKKVLSHKGVKFTNRKYASMQIFHKLEGALNMTKSPMIILDHLKSFYSSDKYQAFRQHPQGTLEWRGPRGFLQNKNFHKSFFIDVLYKLVVFFTEAIDMKKLEIGNGFISKQEFFEVFKKEITPKGEENRKFHDMSNADIAEAYRKFGKILTKFKFNFATLKTPFKEKLVIEKISIAGGKVENCDITHINGSKNAEFNNVSIGNCNQAESNVFNNCIIQNFYNHSQNKFNSCVFEKIGGFYQSIVYDTIINYCNNGIAESTFTKFELNMEGFFIKVKSNIFTDGVFNIKYKIDISHNKFRNIKLVNNNSDSKIGIHYNDFDDCTLTGFDVNSNNNVKNSTLINCKINLRNVNWENNKYINCVNDYGDVINV